jgi:hypothetical protein
MQVANSVVVGTVYGKSVGSKNGVAIRICAGPRPFFIASLMTPASRISPVIPMSDKVNTLASSIRIMR